MQTTGMPLSTQVTGRPSTSSTALPVGNSAPHVEPATSRNSMGIGALRTRHAVDASVAVVADRPSGVCERRDGKALRVLHPDPHVGRRRRVRRPVPLRGRRGRRRRAGCRSSGCRRPRRGRARPARRGSRRPRRRARTRRTTATFDVSGWPPPMPSISRTSGEPMAASRTASRVPRRRQIRGVKVQALGRPTAHHRAPNRRLCAHVVASST